MERKQLDPISRIILGLDDLEPGDAISGDSSAVSDNFDPVGEFRFRQEFGIEPPNTKVVAAPQSVEETRKALDVVRRAIGGQDPFALRLQKLNVSFPSLAASSEEYLGADSAVTQFFQGAATGDDDAMKHALHRMLTEAPVN